MMNSQEAWEKQEKIIEYYKENNPELIECKKVREESDIFQEIGIWNIPQNRQKGFIRLLFQDFIVEEKTQNNKIVRINEISNEILKRKEGDQKSLYAHMIKVGLTTTTALERISKLFELKSNIGYAGLKDEEAITAQLIALHKIRRTPEEIQNAKIPNVLLTNFYYGESTLRPGYLDGNVFTITVRTQNKVDENELAVRLRNIGQYGILNYYQSQRFGGVRLDSHKIGKLICQGKYELAIRFLLFHTNKYEMPIIAKLKKEGEKVYPDYNKLIEIFEKFPYSFYQELRVINYLKNNPGDFTGALREIKDSITICIYAYGSLLFNRHLSVYSKKNGCVEEVFPLLLSNDRNDYNMYREFLEEDNTVDFIRNIKPLRFIYLTKRTCPGRVFPRDINFKTFDGGAVINFFLRKGSYATTMLSSLFEIYEGKPIPEWVSNNEVDAKKLLGQGSLDELKEIFKDCWNKKIN